MSETAPELLVETPQPGVRLLRLNRPERRNALATPLLTAIADALDAAAADPEVRVAVIAGTEKVFAAGADINELAKATRASAAADPRVGLWARIRGFRKPLLAAVEGWCLGAGCELLMCCDYAVAGADARFGQPETNLGIIPGAGGTATLPRLVGRTLAMKMVLTGEPLPAPDAWRAGLVGEIAEPGHALGAALALAGKLAGRAPLALAAAKASVRAAFDQPESEHFGYERALFSDLMDSADKKEGLAAFLDKRPPVWTGR